MKHWSHISCHKHRWKIVPLNILCLTTWSFNCKIRLLFVLFLSFQVFLKAWLLIFKTPLSKSLKPQVFCKSNELVQFLLFDLDKAGVEELQQGLQQVWVDPPHEDDRPERMWQWVTTASSNEYWTPEKRHKGIILKPYLWLELFSFPRTDSKKAAPAARIIPWPGNSLPSLDTRVTSENSVLAKWAWNFLLKFGLHSKEHFRGSIFRVFVQDCFSHVMSYSTKYVFYDISSGHRCNILALNIGTLSVIHCN